MEAEYTFAEAANPETPPEVLAHIAYQQPNLRPVVAVNPNTYPDLLTWLSNLNDPAVAVALAAREQALAVPNTVAPPEPTPDPATVPVATLLNGIEPTAAATEAKTSSPLKFALISLFAVLIVGSAGVAGAWALGFFESEDAASDIVTSPPPESNPPSAAPQPESSPSGEPESPEPPDRSNHKKLQDYGNGATAAWKTNLGANYSDKYNNFLVEDGVVVWLNFECEDKSCHGTLTGLDQNDGTVLWTNANLPPSAIHLFSRSIIRWENHILLGDGSKVDLRTGNLSSLGLPPATAYAIVDDNLLSITADDSHDPQINISLIGSDKSPVWKKTISCDIKSLAPMYGNYLRCGEKLLNVNTAKLQTVGKNKHVPLSDGGTLQQNEDKGTWTHFGPSGAMVTTISDAVVSTRIIPTLRCSVSSADIQAVLNNENTRIACAENDSFLITDWPTWINPAASQAPGPELKPMYSGVKQTIVGDGENYRRLLVDSKTGQIIWQPNAGEPSNNVKYQVYSADSFLFSLETPRSGDSTNSSLVFFLPK